MKNNTNNSQAQNPKISSVKTLRIDSNLRFGDNQSNSLSPKVFLTESKNVIKNDNDDDNDNKRDIESNFLLPYSNTFRSLTTDSICKQDSQDQIRALTVSPIQANKYFGMPARNNFFSRLKWLSNHRSKREVDNENAISHIILDKEPDTGFDYPFAPKRPDHHLTLEDQPEDDNLLQYYLSQPTFTSQLEDEGSDTDFQQKISIRDSEFDNDKPSELLTFSKNTKNYQFQDTISQSSIDTSIYIEKDSNTQISPRSKYLEGCIRTQVNPRASLLIRKHLTKELKLQHQRIGDHMALLLAESLPDLLFVNTFNISDNCLTDTGLTAILNSITNIPNLYQLDISENIIGINSAKSLANYLIRKDCPIQKLNLSKCEISDNECEKFAQCMKKCKNLRYVDLSNNKLGQGEALTAVNEEYVTAGSAIADLLRSSHCHIETLILKWNMLRYQGAVEVAKSLIINSHLTYLDLSYNSLGTEGGIALGDAIIENKTLKTLLLVNNSINDTACFTICVGIQLNQTLSNLVLDGNPIGELGAFGLMLVPLTSGNRLKISAVNCNINIKNPQSWLSPESLSRTYVLNLDHPFERALALTVLDLVAYSDTLSVSSMTYKAARSYKHLSVDILQVAIKRKNSENTQIDAVQDLNYLIRLAENNTISSEFFGSLSENSIEEYIPIELLFQKLKALSVTVDRIGFHSLLSVLHGEQKSQNVSNFINCYQFQKLLAMIKYEVKERLKDLEYLPVMAVNSSSASYQKYIPPKSGVLTITVTDNYLRKSLYRTISYMDCTYVRETAGVSRDTIKLVSYAIQNIKLRLLEGLQLFDALHRECGINKIKVLTLLLPQMISPGEALLLLIRATNDDKAEIQRVKQSLGLLHRILLGNPNGYYCLDLSKPFDRLCLGRLMEQSKRAGQRKALSIFNSINRTDTSNNHHHNITLNTPSGYTPLGDTSQHSNASCFRNEIMNNVTVEMSPAMLTPIPKSGRLEFDFSGADLPPPFQLPITDSACIKLLVNICLIPRNKVIYATRKLKAWRDDEHRIATCGLGKPLYETEKDKAKEIGNFCTIFYNNLLQRAKQVELSEKKEEVKIDLSAVNRDRKKDKTANKSKKWKKMTNVIKSKAVIKSSTHGGVTSDTTPATYQSLTTPNMFEEVYNNNTPQYNTVAATTSTSSPNRYNNDHNNTTTMATARETIIEDTSNTNTPYDTTDLLSTFRGATKRPSSRERDKSIDKQQQQYNNNNITSSTNSAIGILRGGGRGKLPKEKSGKSQYSDEDFEDKDVFYDEDDWGDFLDKSSSDSDSSGASSGGESVETLGSRRNPLTKRVASTPGSARHKKIHIPANNSNSGNRHSHNNSDGFRTVVVVSSHKNKEEDGMHGGESNGHFIGKQIQETKHTLNPLISVKAVQNPFIALKEAKEKQREFKKNAIENALLKSILPHTTLNTSNNVSQSNPINNEDYHFFFDHDEEKKKIIAYPSDWHYYDITEKTFKDYEEKEKQRKIEWNLHELQKQESHQTNESNDTSNNIHTVENDVFDNRNILPVSISSTPYLGSNLHNHHHHHQQHNSNANNSSNNSVGGNSAPAKLQRRSSSIFKQVILSEQDQRHIEAAHKHKLLMEAANVPPQPKAAKILEVLQDIFFRVYIRARHLALIINYFSIGSCRKTQYFGTYKVELVVMAYSRIVDRNNFEVVLGELNGEETACVMCRLGWLNLFNPLKPEGCWELDFSRYEERLIAKMLIALQNIEPGETWLDRLFRWDRGDDDIPGWTLVQSWLKDRGVPRRGVIFINYYSGDGEGLSGCSPNVPFRCSLLQLVSLDRNDFYDLTAKNSEPIYMKKLLAVKPFVGLRKVVALIMNHKQNISNATNELQQSPFRENVGDGLVQPQLLSVLSNIYSQPPPPSTTSATTTTSTSNNILLPKSKSEIIKPTSTTREKPLMTRSSSTISPITPAIPEEPPLYSEPNSPVLTGNMAILEFKNTSGKKLSQLSPNRASTTGTTGTTVNDKNILQGNKSILSSASNAMLPTNQKAVTISTPTKNSSGNVSLSNNEMKVSKRTINSPLTTNKNNGSSSVSATSPNAPAPRSPEIGQAAPAGSAAVTIWKSLLLPNAQPRMQVMAPVGLKRLEKKETDKNKKTAAASTSNNNNGIQLRKKKKTKKKKK